MHFYTFSIHQAGRHSFAGRHPVGAYDIITPQAVLCASRRDSHGLPYESELMPGLISVLISTVYASRDQASTSCVRVIASLNRPICIRHIFGH